MLKILSSALLYTALSLTAIPAAAQDLIALNALREGDLRKLNFHDTPQEVSQLSFADLDGNVETLADYEGKLVILNFWATWCFPCREEMPAFDQLSAAYADQDFVVLPIASGHNPVPAIKKFYANAGIEHLPIRIEPTGKLAAEMGVRAFPGSFIISPNGKEIASLVGDAEWFSDSAQAIVEELLGSYTETDG
ncbi:TlpA disulfide reductase family protein [Celeribacter litoreus]|uniref:TlpA disulfide reductase family protein n=1 Tax=Celeribacter litoreus TaxID=2876714 RepID=UPI001CCAEA09|nr:TlpA disulfide reductase family protein [Celeribacter litoreus]MCA0044334.1 TlpA family protein disulfide reductase [Celeribacter litoreus]